MSKLSYKKILTRDYKKETLKKMKKFYKFWPKSQRKKKHIKLKIGAGQYYYKVVARKKKFLIIYIKTVSFGEIRL